MRLGPHELLAGSVGGPTSSKKGSAEHDGPHSAKSSLARYL